ncbi:hypothetical protein YB2330_004788 [Saitoella coloradoensis]
MIPPLPTELHHQILHALALIDPTTLIHTCRAVSFPWRQYIDHNLLGLLLAECGVYVLTNRGRFRFWCTAWDVGTQEAMLGMDTTDRLTRKNLKKIARGEVEELESGVVVRGVDVFFRSPTFVEGFRPPIGVDSPSWKEVIVVRINTRDGVIDGLALLRAVFWMGMGLDRAVRSYERLIEKVKGRGKDIEECFEEACRRLKVKSWSWRTQRYGISQPLERDR